MYQTDDSRNTVELSETLGDHCYWEEIKGNGCKYYRNAVTNGYLGKYRNSSSLNKRNGKYVENVVFIKWSTKKKMSHCQQERKEQCLLPMSVQPASQYKMKTIVELFFFFFNLSVRLQGLTPAGTRSTLRSARLCLKSG